MLCLSLWVVSHAYSLKHGCAHVTNDGSLIPRGSLGTHLWPAEAWLNDSQFLVKRSLPKPANGCPTYDCIGLLLMWQLSLGKEQRNLETTTLLEFCMIGTSISKRKRHMLPNAYTSFAWSSTEQYKTIIRKLCYSALLNADQYSKKNILCGYLTPQLQGQISMLMSISDDSSRIILG